MVVTATGGVCHPPWRSCSGGSRRRPAVIIKGDDGAIEGVAGPEAANNASSLLALGLPVTATASILLAAMQSYGIVPGPTLMADQADLVWTPCW